MYFVITCSKYIHPSTQHVVKQMSLMGGSLGNLSVLTLHSFVVCTRV